MLMVVYIFHNNKKRNYYIPKLFSDISTCKKNPSISFYIQKWRCGQSSLPNNHWCWLKFIFYCNVRLIGNIVIVEVPLQITKKIPSVHFIWESYRTLLSDVKQTIYLNMNVQTSLWNGKNLYHRPHEV